MMYVINGASFLIEIYIYLRKHRSEARGWRLCLVYYYEFNYFLYQRLAFETKNMWFENKFNTSDENQCCTSYLKGYHIWKHGILMEVTLKLVEGTPAITYKVIKLCIIFHILVSKQGTSYYWYVVMKNIYCMLKYQ